MNGECAECGLPSRELWCLACAGRKAEALRREGGVLVRVDGRQVRVPAEVASREGLEVARPHCPACFERLRTYDGGRSWLCLRCGFRDDEK